jgi:hypothetical protein
MSVKKKGASALGSLNSSGGSGQSAEITSLKSGTTLKIRVKGTEDLAQYYGYGVFKKVYTFVPKNPAERNGRGFVTANPTPWDQAAQYYVDLAKQAEDDGDSKKAEELKAEARKYRGKERYLMGFANLETGEDIIVDLTKPQALAVYETIMEYEEDGQYAEMAFKLSKKGESTSTTVTLTPIVNMAKGLTDDETKHFEATADKPFDHTLFDSVLYEADEAEQIENLVKAGFDVSLIRLSVETSADDDEVTPIDDSDASVADPTDDF